MTEKLALELTLVLPGVPDERDSCIQRLTDVLQAQGLEKVHVVQQDGHACLCLHYDPAQFGLKQAAGAQLSERYQHELMRIDGMDCSTCATVIEHALHRLDGVLEASVSYGRLHAPVVRHREGVAQGHPASASGFGLRRG